MKLASRRLDEPCRDDDDGDGLQAVARGASEQASGRRRRRRRRTSAETQRCMRGRSRASAKADAAISAREAWRASGEMSCTSRPATGRSGSRSHASQHANSSSAGHARRTARAAGAAEGVEPSQASASESMPTSRIAEAQGRLLPRGIGAQTRSEQEQDEDRAVGGGSRSHVNEPHHAISPPSRGFFSLPHGRVRRPRDNSGTLRRGCALCRAPPRT